MPGIGRRLLIGAITLVALTAGCSSRTTPQATPVPSGVPATIVVQGHTLYFRGSEPIKNPFVDEEDPALLRLRASNSGDEFNCELTPVARLQSETPDAVTVVIARYGVANTAQNREHACAGSGAGLLALSVTLHAPLDRRRLIDAGDGNRARPVLDPSTTARLTALPVGFRQTSFDWLETSGEMMRGYGGPNDDSLLLEQSPNLSLAGQHGATIVRKFLVHGRPAVMTVGPGFPEDFIVVWQPDSRTVLRLSQASSWPVHHGLSADQLQVLAEKVIWPG